MRSRRTCISTGDDLSEAAFRRCKALGYDSFSAYVVGLIRADLITLPGHELALKISQSGGVARDKIDAGLNRQSVVVLEDPEADMADDVIDLAKAYRQQRVRSLADLRTPAASRAS